MDFDSSAVSEVVEQIKQGKVDAIEWNKYFIQNIKEKEASIHAWAYFNEEHWLQQCVEVMKMENPVHDKLLAAPVGVKDIFNTIDMPTEMGSPIWRGFTPGNDARVVHNIRFNQGIIAGKTITAEFAVHTPNETRNPWDRDYSPGTSSSGSAAAVSARMVPLALATQTAGSVIRPASYCGIYGFKPSFGTIPRTAMLKTTDSLDSVGMYATNVYDCELLFDVIRVHGLDYPIVNEKLADKILQNKIGHRWKLGIVNEQIWTHEHASSYALEQFNEVLLRLQSLNLDVVKPPFGENFQRAHKQQEKIYHKSLSYYFKKEFENHTLISPVMYSIVEEGRGITLDEYKSALSFQDNLSKEIDDMFGDLDLLVTLSTAGIAPSFGTAIDPPDTCLIWTLCGLPTINIPLFNHHGLPFGLQIVARKYSDYKLLTFVKEMVEANMFPKFCPIPVTVES